jgi:hypothetical protein
MRNPFSLLKKIVRRLVKIHVDSANGKITQRQLRKAVQTLAKFHPQTVIRCWGNGDAFHLADALTGVCIFGATGSGKTSGPAKHLAYGYLAAGFGGLVLCAKPEERRQWEQWAAECGRAGDLVIVDASGANRFNFMAWESSRPEAGGGLGINIVNLLDEIAGAISGQDEGGNSKFWQDSLHYANTNLVDLILLAGLEVSLPLLRSILTTAAMTPEQALDTVWRKESVCAKAIEEADRLTMDAHPHKRANFEEVRDSGCWNIPASMRKPAAS